jgi:hypothetical protein
MDKEIEDIANNNAITALADWHMNINGVEVKTDEVLNNLKLNANEVVAVMVKR